MRGEEIAYQVASLNAYQRSGVFHEFTGGDGETLVATNDGWVMPNDPVEVVQDWAHEFMADWSWRPPEGSIGDMIMNIANNKTAPGATTRVRFLGLGNGFEDVTLDVTYIAEYARGPGSTCAFCHGDPCADGIDKTSDIAQFFAKNKWATVCPVCEAKTT